jgi:uncharacterized protein (TIGR02391 family)
MTVQTRQSVPVFDAQQMQAICRILGDTDDGLSGSQIGYLLQDSKIPDVDPGATKWKRLFNAFIAFQNENQVGNHVVVFINRAMNPASYTANPTNFRLLQDRLNTVLAFCGMQVGDDGKTRRTGIASSLDEATLRANRMRASLVQRNVHSDVLAFCNAELLQDNYFHAVFEAMKGITSRLRTMTGSSNDGSELVHTAFAAKNGSPMFVINAFDTETLKGEQRGFVNLLLGLFGMIRNPLAHNPKVEWDMTEQDAMDVMTTISLIFRKLDKAKKHTT